MPRLPPCSWIHYAAGVNPAANLLSAPKPPAPAARAGRSPALALAGLSLAVLLSTLNTSIVNVALPTLTGVFHASTQAAQWAVISFVLAITTLIVGVGRLADIVGRKRLLLAGIALFTAAAGACAAAPSLGGLIAFRFLQGTGAAMMMALSVALIGDLAPQGKTGRAMGLLGSMSAIGTALGPALGGLLISAFGWPAIFLINVPLGLGTFVLLLRHLPADRMAGAARWREFDGFGTVLLALSVAAYALGLTRQQGGFDGGNLTLLALAAGGMFLFMRVQGRSASPLLRMEWLEAGALRSGLAMSLLVAAVMMSTLVVGPFYLAQTLAVPPGTMGLALSVGPLMAALVAGPAGRLVDRIGTRLTTVFGLAGAGAGCLALALLPERSGMAGYLIPVAIMTAGYSLFQTANNTAVMHGAAPDQRGLVSGLLNLSRNLGLITGVSLLGGVFAFAAGDASPPGPDTVAFATRMTFSSATVFIMGALVLGLRPIRPNPAHAPVGPAAGQPAR